MRSMRYNEMDRRYTKRGGVVRRSGSHLVILNMIGYILVIVVNGLANALPLNGITTGDISDLYPNYFTPAGFTFGIWGAIYLLLGIFILRQTAYYFRYGSVPVEVEKIGFVFLFSCFMNMAWIIAWHFLYISLSFIIMLFLLTSLVIIYLRLRDGHLAGRRAASFLDFWSMHAPFRLYLGWITAATLANLTVLLIHRGFDAMTTAGMVWAVTMVFVAMVLGLLVLIAKRDLIYTSVLLWTFVGILYKRINAPELVLPVVIMAGVGIIMLLYGFLRVKATSN